LRERWSAARIQILAHSSISPSASTRVGVVLGEPPAQIDRQIGVILEAGQPQMNEPPVSLAKSQRPIAADFDDDAPDR
jgi:hypothetical protein